MGDIVGASNLIGITTLEQVRRSMAMEDVPDVSISVLFIFKVDLLLSNFVILCANDVLS